MKTWNAFQIVMSNGAYGGKTVTFEDNGRTRTGVLRRANSSDNGTDVLMLVTAPNGDNDWHRVPGETLVEVH